MSSVDASEQKTGHEGWSEILVPVRGGADAYARAALALRLAQGFGARVTALYVLDERMVGDPDAGLVRETVSAQLLQEGERVLQRVATLAEQTSVSFVSRIELGPVVETILKVAKATRADVIVVGSHRQTWLGRLLGVSVAESLLGAATCTIVAVPPSATRS
jgi:nucleotide-binding universal stress UspA family protein